MRSPAPSIPEWIERMLPEGTERYTVDVGHPMHVMEAGDAEGRPVLMLHGNPTWGFLYRKVAAELLGEKLRLIMPDMIGLGFSGKPKHPSEHTLDNHIAWTQRLMEALDLRGLIHVGQDWGGPIGYAALRDLRDRLAGLVVLNTVPGPPRPGFKPTLFHRLAAAPVVSEILFRGLGFPQNALFMAQGDKRSLLGGPAARAYRYPLRGLGRNQAPLALARMVADSQQHPSIPGYQRARDLVESWDGPAAIVWGDRDPVLGSVRTAFERLLPQAPVTRTRAGHFLQEEVPGEIAQAVREVAARSDTIAADR